LLNGAVVGELALVAAGAVVLEGQEIPPQTLAAGVPAAGVPARVIRELTEEELDKLRESPAYYSGKAKRYMNSGVNTLSTK